MGENLLAAVDEPMKTARGEARMMRLPKRGMLREVPTIFPEIDRTTEENVLLI